MKTKKIEVVFKATSIRNLTVKTNVVVPETLVGGELEEYLYAYQREQLDHGDYDTITDAGDWKDDGFYLLDNFFKIHELVGEPTNLEEALKDDTRYVESYAMVSDREKGDHLFDRSNGDEGVPDYWDFTVRSEVLDGDCYKEVEDVPIELSNEVGELLAKFYQCKIQEAN